MTIINEKLIDTLYNNKSVKPIHEIILTYRYEINLVCQIVCLTIYTLLTFLKGKEIFVIGIDSKTTSY